MSADLDQAIREVIRESYEMFGDHEPDEAIARLHKEKAEQLRRLNDGSIC